MASILIVVVCCALGLSIGTSPTEENDPNLVSIGVYEPQLNWHYAFLAAGSCFLIVELWRQQRQLKCQISVAAAGAMRAGWKWAILSRQILIAVLVLSLSLMFLLQQRIFEYAEAEESFYVLTDEVFPQSVWYVAFLVALAIAAPTADDRSRGVVRTAIDAIAGWVCGTMFVAYMVADFFLITYLVHLATAGIYATRALRLQHIYYFPNHTREGWFTFFVSTAAFVTLFIATVCFVSLCRFSIRCSTRVALSGLYVVALGACGAFSLWFYREELHRVSPDIAPQIANAAMFRDWLGASLLLMLASVVGAIRLTRDDNTSASIASPIRTSGMAMLAIVPGLISFVLLWIECLRSVWAPGPWGAGHTVMDTVRFVLTSPYLLLQLAIGILAFQIAWRWWGERRARDSNCPN